MIYKGQKVQCMCSTRKMSQISRLSLWILVAQMEGDQLRGCLSCFSKKSQKLINRDDVYTVTIFGQL